VTKPYPRGHHDYVGRQFLAQRGPSVAFPLIVVSTRFDFVINGTDDFVVDVEFAQLSHELQKQCVGRGSFTAFADLSVQLNAKSFDRHLYASFSTEIDVPG
jgi:hypothetical protein